LEGGGEEADLKNKTMQADVNPKTFMHKNTVEKRFTSVKARK